MNHKRQHDRLAQLGEELLREFDATQTPKVSAEFDRRCRNALFWRKEKSICQFARWTAQAAMIIFALIGAMTVAVLSIGPLRNELIRHAAGWFAPVQEEHTAEYVQISHAQMDNAALTVYYDGTENYQILYSDEFGQQQYNFRSESMEEDFFRDLGRRLNTTVD